MSLNYAKRLPTDQGGTAMQEYPAAQVALQNDTSENNTVSSVITMNDNTTVLEIGATGGAAVLRWITTGNTNASVISAAGTANYDHIIPSNTYRRFVVPVEGIGTSSIVGLNKASGLYNRVAVKSVGISSVATIQF